MYVTRTWEEKLYPHTSSGEALKSFVHSHPIWTSCFDAEDRRVLDLVRFWEWDRLALNVRAETGYSLGRYLHTESEKQIRAGERLYHPLRRVMRPKKVLIFNRHKGH